MDQEKAKEFIRENWRQLIGDITTPAKNHVNGEPSYICPICGQHGQHGDGLTFIPGNPTTLKCFGCDWKGDIIQLYMDYQKTDFVTTFKQLADKLNINIENDAAVIRARIDEKHNQDKTLAPEVKPPQNGNMGTSGANPAFTAYFRACRARLTDPAAVTYLNGRGISIKTAEFFNVGYDPQADPAGSGHKSPRLIIPTSEYHYVGRAITENPYPKLNPKGSTPDITNNQALYNPDVKCVFVTEGVFDAMSVHEVAPDGCDAIALNSTSNADKLITLMREQPTDAVLIICMDNDAAGKKAAAKLTQGLEPLAVDYFSYDICGSCTDPADRLKNDRENFILSVKAAANAAAQPNNTADYFTQRKETDCKAYQTRFLTGFKNLDAASGGLRPGLYVLAAISSLGKTTFAHQIAENMAAEGQHVLFFSMEQSILELTSKSLRRIISVKCGMDNPITTLKIMEGNRELPVTDAENFYSATIGRNLSIIEGNFECDVKFITEYIKRYIRRNQCKPVVIVDYLQILQPAVDKIGRRQTTKETVDITTTELKRLSRAQGIPILAISSVNRMNYTLPVDFEALKESGNIEFTADVVWGLQLHCLQEKLFTQGEKKTVEKRERVRECKRANPRELDLVCLKNRFGISSYICNFKYHTNNDLFEPWELTLAERLKTVKAAEPPRQVKKKPANDGYADPATLPTWAQLMQPKQGTFFKMLQGRVYDVDGKIIELTYTTIAGRKNPAVKSPDGGNMVRILTEKEYNAILEYNQKRKTAAPDFADFSKTDPGDLPF